MNKQLWLKVGVLGLLVLSACAKKHSSTATSSGGGASATASHVQIVGSSH